MDLGGCRILEEIGKGATGTVYKAERSGALVAVKVLDDAWAGDAEVTNRFVSEGLIMAQLSHPGIVKVYDAGRDGGKFYIVMEYVEGPSFARAIQKRAFTPKERALIGVAVARAVQHAHRRGVIHSDIAPRNILLKGDGSPKLTDFGIARLQSRGPGGERTGVTAGTPVYMSPEQASGMHDVIDARTDVYSLGAVLYEAMTGRAPFSGRTTSEILEKVVSVSPPPPRQVDPSIDPVLEKILLKAMDKDPARRYSGMKEFADALEEWVAGVADVFGVTPP